MIGYAIKEEWIKVEPGVVFDWHMAECPEGHTIVRGPGLHRVFSDGASLNHLKIFKLKTGPAGYVTYYVVDRSGDFVMDGDDIAVSTFHGNVEYSYRLSSPATPDQDDH